MPDFTASTGLQALTKTQMSMIETRKANKKKPRCGDCQKQIDYRDKDSDNYCIEEFVGSAHRPYYSFFHLCCPRNVMKLNDGN